MLTDVATVSNRWRPLATALRLLATVSNRVCVCVCVPLSACVCVCVCVCVITVIRRIRDMMVQLIIIWELSLVIRMFSDTEV